MGGNIPRPIKIEVIKKWLQGKSRNQIAEEEGIGTGTVSSITNERRQNDPEFDLMRHTAIKLKLQGDTMESFAHLVRLREIMRGLLQDRDASTTRTTVAGREEREGEQKEKREQGEEGSNRQETQQNKGAAKVEEKIESLIVALQVFCFKHNLSINEFANLVYDLSCTADKLGVPLENLPGYIKQLESNVQRLDREIEEKRLEKQDAIADHDATLDLLEEFSANRPLFKRNQKLKKQLDEMTKLAGAYKREIDDGEFDRDWEMCISEEELDDANRKLGLGDSSYPTPQQLNPDKLYKIAMYIYHSPSEFVDIIRPFMKDKDIWN
jgi:transcriptional regulator with XRE-family HTH domain